MRDFQRLSVMLSSAQSAVRLFRISGVEEAVACAAFEDPDVILLDLTRPDSMGLASVIVVSKAFPDTPVITVTSLRDRSLAESAVALGAWGYVSGPSIDGEVLLDVLGAALSENVTPFNINAADSV